MAKIVSRECRFVYHRPASAYNKDTHIVKELLHYSDGTKKKNLRLIENFKRPFWTTKEHYRNHKQKKESEDTDKLLEGKATQSDLGRAIAVKLGSMYNGVKDLYSIKSSPYVYGIDVNSRTYIKYLYQKQYPDVSTPYEVCVLDIEVDTIKNELVIISIAMNDKIHTIITKDYLKQKFTTKDNTDAIQKDVTEKLEYLYGKYVPKTDLSQSIKRSYSVVDDDLTAVLETMSKLHVWNPDIVAVWNINYDMEYILDILDKNHIDPKEVMCDPDLPKELRYFKFTPGRDKTAKGGGINPEERWPIVDCPANFYWIDAMCAHRYIRVGGKAMSGGYSLDNILNHELGSDFKKLKFKDDAEGISKVSIEWHQHMVANKPLEYITYNQWDVMSILELDSKTKDLHTVMPMLAGLSNFDVFNSGPKRIVDALHFYYLENDRVLSVKDPKAGDDKLLGLSNWIVLLPSCRISERGGDILKGGGVDTNIRMFVADSDQVSGYPSNTQAANVSIDTTAKELKSIDGIGIDTFREQNINMLFGKINSLDYGTEMFNLPTMYEIAKLIEKK